MISIFNNDETLITDACEKHLKGLKVDIGKRINKYSSSFDFITSAKDYILDNYKSILTAKPDVLLKMSEEYNNFANGLSVIDNDRFDKATTSVFNYDWFCENKKKYSAYKLTANLKVTVCPYCNANFIITAYTKAGNRITRPSLDHFFSQSKHKLLSLSFYNLIPSCSICNSSIKGSKELLLDKHFHPFLHNIKDNIVFRYVPHNVSSAIGFKEDFDLKIESVNKLDSRAIDHTLFFKLEDIYNHHKSYVSEIILKSYMYDDKYYEVLSREFPDLKIKPSDFYRVIFGNFWEDEDMGKRPLSKLTKDLVQQLKKRVIF